MNSTLFAEHWARLAGLVLTNLLWQGALVGVAAAAAFVSARQRSPHTRHALACAGLLAMAALLPLNLLWLNSSNASTALPPAPETDIAYTPLPTANAGNVTAPPLPTAPIPEQSNTRPRLTALQWYHLALPWLGRCWIAGILLFALYDLAGVLALHRMRRRSREVSEEIAALAARVKNRLGVRAKVQIRWLEGIASAFVTGWFRPVILLPAAMAARMTTEAIEAILAHEFAHIRRWDIVVNTLQRAVEALLFFHPVVWWLSAQIRNERELCCDEDALRVCKDRGTYVRALLALAEAGRETQAFALSSQGGKLRVRVQRILGHPTRTGVSAQGRLLVALIALTTTLLPLCTALLSASSSAQELPERTLNFPGGKSVGVVYGRWSDQNYREFPWMPDHNAGWTLLGEAQGAVMVPEGTLVKLEVTNNDLSFLRGFDKNSIFFLDCARQQLSDDALRPITKLTGLRALRLSYNETMTGEIFQHCASLKQLEWLDVEMSPMPALEPEALAQFQHLKYITGHLKAHSDGVLVQLGSLNELEYIRMRGESVTAEGLRPLSGKKKLLGLMLDDTHLTDDDFAALGPLPNLLYLNLRKNLLLTDLALEQLSRYPKLEQLNLDYTGISDAGMASLAALPSLKQLSAEYTQLTPACLDSLKQLPALSMVNLFATGVSEAQSAELAKTLLTENPPLQVQQKSSNPAAPKVGLVMSHYTATGPSRIGKPYTYGAQSTRGLAPALNNANLDVYAVVERDTQYLGELPVILQEAGLLDKTIDGYDPEALKTLDVIVVCSLYNAKLELVQAIETAVRDGVGLVNIGALSVRDPDVKEIVESITGLEEAHYEWRGWVDIPCTVASAHPILGNLRQGTVVYINPVDGNGSLTNVLLGATVLLTAPSEHPEGFPALYIRNHGQGRVVRAQWHRPIQPKLPLPGYTLYIRAINWAAGRDPDTVW